jgi:CHAD domain-containing protein
VVDMGMNHHTEQEWQFSARDLDSARSWLAAQPHEASERRFASRPTLTMRDTYYDSPDWMIFRAGFALRVREARESDDTGIGETEITLKSLHRAHNGIARRTEISESMGSAGLDEVLARDNGIGGRIRELVGTRPLAALFHVRTRRERQQLLEADTDLPLAEVDLDETSIETLSGQAQEMRRVEVECINAEPEAVSPFVEQLRAAAQLEPVDVSKFRAGLAAAGLEPPAQQPEAGNPGIDAAQPFATAQLATLRRYFSTVLAKEAAVRAGSTQAVHEMRVAGRHLEVLLRMFRGFGPRWAVSARPRVRALIRHLGAVRDCDVQLAYLDDALTSLPLEGRKAFEPMRERLTSQHARARARLLRALDSPAIRHWVQDWERHLRAGTPGSTRAQRATTAEVARTLVRDAAQTLRKRARRIDEDSAPDDYHEVRIRAKRLRYTLDAFADLYGEAAQSYAKALGKLQTVLGEYNDASVREKRFTELVTGGPRLPSTTSFLAGRLVERDVQAFSRCRKKFGKAYRRVRGRRWRELSVAMQRVAQSVAETRASESE